VLEIDSDRVELLRRLGMKVYYGDATRHDLLEAAGADKARLIVLALENPEKVLEMVETVRKHFPHLKILARADDRFAAYDLIERDVEYVYRETFDTALHMGVDALRLLGFRAYHAQRAAQTFARYDEAALRELASMRDDDAVYFNRARQRIIDLEKYLQADLNRDNGDQERDAAWDVETLIEDVRQQALDEEQARS
jgi:voltage-gated potassium channel Kch